MRCALEQDLHERAFKPSCTFKGRLGAQVKAEETASEGTVTGTPLSRAERPGSKVAKALALEAQLRSVDGAVMEQLQTARAESGCSASLDSKVPAFTTPTTSSTVVSELLGDDRNLGCMGMTLLQCCSQHPEQLYWCEN